MASEQKPNVLLGVAAPQRVEEYLSEHARVFRPEGPGRDALFAALAEADGFLTAGTRIDDGLLERAPRLKIVSNVSVGYNNFDLEAMKRRGVMGTNTPGVLDDTVADLIMALVLGTARRVAELDRLVREGGWKKGMNEELFGVDVHHRKLGIIGMGRIGEAVAKRARLGFDMDVVYHNRRRNEAAEERLGIEWRSMDDLLAECDFVVVMTPLTPATEGLIGEEQFRKMKPSAIFINASRGPVVDEAALIRALSDGTIRAAGLDVFEQEPVQPDNPLLFLPNTVLVPHIGSATAATRFDMAMLAAQNLVAGIKGEVPPNLVPELQEMAPAKRD
jgi:gluconate 2-dehydrogenase